MSINRIKMVFLGTILSVLILAPVSAMGQNVGNTVPDLPTGATLVGDDPKVLTPGGTVGLFCEVEKVGVCVTAQTEEDCTKLGGKKVDSCMAEKTEDKK